MYIMTNSNIPPALQTHTRTHRLARTHTYTHTTTAQTPMQVEFKMRLPAGVGVSSKKTKRDVDVLITKNRVKVVWSKFMVRMHFSFSSLHVIICA